MADCHTFPDMSSDVAVRTTVYLSQSLRERIAEAATARRLSQAQLIRMWLERAVGQERREPNGGFLTQGDLEGPNW